MKERKNIDDLFREGFENFEATPPADTWDQIAAKLQKKKKDRKIIPIWWRVAGVAALLALLFTIGNSVFGPQDINNKLSEEDQPKIENESIPAINGDQEEGEDNSQFASDDLQNAPDGKKSEDNIEFTEDKASDMLAVPENSKEGVADTDSKSPVHQKKDYTQESPRDPVIREKVSTGVVGDKEAIANSKIQGGKKTQEFSNDKIITDKEIVQDTKKEAVAINKNKDNKDLPEDLKNQDIPKVGSDDLIKKDGVISEKGNTDIAKNDEKETEEKIKDPTEENKRSIFDAIEENKEEEAIAKTNVPDDRWEVTPNVGPVYYSSFGEGSSIDPSFADNTQSGDVNFSYGANISYAISEKLSIRTGVNNVNLSYSTGGLELGTGPVSAALSSVDYGGRQLVTTAVDIGTLQNNNTGNDPFGNLVPKSAGQEAFLNQSLRYYEVPLEMKYSVFNNKFGMHLIGGFSSLFLADNEVSVEAGDFRTVLGEANNLNSLSFTTNIGLGFDYKIGKRLKFNIEPMFKYQLNPYTDSSVDFNPYYLGVYTGLSFKF